MQNLRYVGKNLFIEKLSIKNFLKKNKTPFYIYSENQISLNFLKFQKIFKKTNPLICFAAKSNSNFNILRTLGRLGSGADVVSGGELLKALKAGIKPNKIVFSGVGKTSKEISFAIDKNILLIHAEDLMKPIQFHAYDNGYTRTDKEARELTMEHCIDYASSLNLSENCVVIIQNNIIVNSAVDKYIRQNAF